MGFEAFEATFKPAALVFVIAGDVREQRYDRAGHGIDILVKRDPTNRTRFIIDLPAEGDLGLALRAHDVAHGASRDGDAGGDLVTHGAQQLPFKLLNHWFFLGLNSKFSLYISFISSDIWNFSFLIILHV